jgi:NAD(P)-dependent dehydrogenase (short-subunit alcohol dehydrogenase family)
MNGPNAMPANGAPAAAPSADRWTAFVTGASRGIGRAITETFVQHRAAVAAGARSSDALAELATHHPDAVQPITIDVRDPLSVEHGVIQAERRLGRIDVLVNAAGVILRRPLLAVTEEDWHQVIETNLGGTFRVSQAVARGMIGRGAGRIINIASNDGIGASVEHSAYDASKAGIAGLTRSLAVELAPYGIWVNAIAPGWTKTAMAAPVLDLPGEAERIAASLPARRIAEAEDIAQVALWLARETTRFMVGALLVVDGGETIGL